MVVESIDQQHTDFLLGRLNPFLHLPEPLSTFTQYLEKAGSLLMEFKDCFSERRRQMCDSSCAPLMTCFVSNSPPDNRKTHAQMHSPF